MGNTRGTVNNGWFIASTGEWVLGTGDFDFNYLLNILIGILTSQNNNSDEDIFSLCDRFVKTNESSIYFNESFNKLPFYRSNILNEERHPLIFN